MLIARYRRGARTMAVSPGLRWSSAAPRLRDQPMGRCDARDSSSGRPTSSTRCCTQAGLDVIGGTSLFRLARHRDAAKRACAPGAAAHLVPQLRSWADDLLRFGLPADAAALDRLAAALATSRAIAQIPPTAR